MRHKPRGTVRVVPASQAKNNFGEVIRRVYEDEETQIIERAGLPVAAIVPMSDLERFMPEKMKDMPEVAMNAKRKRAWKELMAILDENQQAGKEFSDEEVMADALKAVEEVRRSKSKK